MRILIAEDDPASRLLLSTVLRRMGHDVVEASDGEEAYLALQKPEAPRLAIIDWMMPELDGLGLCRRIRAEMSDERPYLIMLTALADKAHAVEGLEAGADDFVVKPFDQDLLGARIASGMRVLEMQERLEAQARSLQEALDQVKTLRGIIPICSHCKRIRDDDDYWQEVADYVSAHTDALFSHGICPSCLLEHYPEMVEAAGTNASKPAAPDDPTGPKKNGKR